MAVSRPSSKCFHHWRPSPSAAGTSCCIHRNLALLLPVTWISKCLDHLLWTIYLVWCCIAVLGVPSLDRYSLQLVLKVILVILQLIVTVATPFFGSETQILAIPSGADLQSMLTPVPLSSRAHRASCYRE